MDVISTGGGAPAAAVEKPCIAAQPVLRRCSFDFFRRSFFCLSFPKGIRVSPESLRNPSGEESLEEADFRMRQSSI
jgi:hypothetical protein